MDKQEQREALRQQSIAASRKAEAPILAELHEAGFELGSLSDLVNTELNYKAAIPILLTWLPRVTDHDVKETLARALTVRWAKPLAAPLLIEEFVTAPDFEESPLKWAIANALSVVADDSVFEKLTELAQDKRQGKAREMLAVALGNMKDPQAVDVLIDLLDDEVVVGHALIALGRLKPKKAKPHIEPFVVHTKAWVRTEAKRALAKIER